jgi:hypothetical protein
MIIYLLSCASVIALWILNMPVPTPEPDQLYLEAMREVEDFLGNP